MTIALHWYLPTHGDGRTLVQAGAAAQLLAETRRPDSAGTGREATLAYLAQVARAAEEAGFDAALTPTGTTCHDAWITCAALSQVVIGLLRTGAGTALVGSHEEIADLMAEYHDLGISEFILSGYPHVEEAYAFGEGVVPVLRRRGLLGEPVAAAA